MPCKMARQTLERHAGACYAGSRPYLGSGLLGSPENRYNLPHFRVHPGNPGCLGKVYGSLRNVRNRIFLMDEAVGAFSSRCDVAC